MRTLKALVVSSFVSFAGWTCGCSEPAASDTVDGGAAGGAPAASRGQEDEVSCEPSAEDDACDACTRSSCCSELDAYFGASGADTFDACIEPCATQACIDGCAEASPSAGRAYDGLDACQRDSCAEPCVCGATSGDSACLACVKAKCCSALMPYALAPDFDGFSTCMEPCEDRACADPCIEEFSAAGPAYAAYSDCALEACPTECG
jgi:hypothetical protein